jgi:Flp pilus assembly protein TadD
MRTTLAIRILALLALAGCTPKPKAAEPPPEVAAATRAQQLINAGNDAFKAGQYELAAKRFAAASIEKPDDPAAFYGLGMSLAKLGRDEQARVAYAKARELNHAQHGP